MGLYWASIDGLGPAIRPKRPVCIACGQGASDSAMGWRAYLSVDPDCVIYTAVYCPVCAEREFGENATSGR